MGYICTTACQMMRLSIMHSGRRCSGKYKFIRLKCLLFTIFFFFLPSFPCLHNRLYEHPSGFKSNFSASGVNLQAFVKALFFSRLSIINEQSANGSTLNMIQYIDLAKPKSGALVSLFSSPMLHRIKTVIKLFSTGCRIVSSMDWKNSQGGAEVGRWGRIDEVWNLGTTFLQLHTCQSAVSSDSLRPSSLFLML